MSKIEGIVPSLLVLLVAVWVGFVSFTQEPAEAFLFPRIVSALFIVFAVITFVQAFLTMDVGEQSLTIASWLKIIPGLLVALLFVFWLAKALGFYTASAITTFVLFSVYDPNSHAQVKSWLMRLVITAVFVAVMYLLFAKLLGVFTPRELLFR